MYSLLSVLHIQVTMFLSLRFSSISRGDVSIALVASTSVDTYDFNSGILGLMIKAEITFLSEIGWNALFCGDSELVVKVDEDSSPCKDVLLSNNVVRNRLYFTCKSKFKAFCVIKKN